MNFATSATRRSLCLLLGLLAVAPATASAAGPSFTEDSLAGKPVVVTSSKGTYAVFRTAERICPPSRLHRCISVSIDGSFERAFDAGSSGGGECYTRHISYKAVPVGRSFDLAFASRSQTGKTGEPFGEVTVKARKRGSGPIRNACKLVR